MLFPADVSRRVVRNPVKGAYPALLFEGSLEFQPFSEFEPIPVKKGSLVLIDGKVGNNVELLCWNLIRFFYVFLRIFFCQALCVCLTTPTHRDFI